MVCISSRRQDDLMAVAAADDIAHKHISPSKSVKMKFTMVLDATISNLALLLLFEPNQGLIKRGFPPPCRLFRP